MAFGEFSISLEYFSFNSMSPSVVAEKTRSHPVEGRSHVFEFVPLSIATRGGSGRRNLWRPAFKPSERGEESSPQGINMAEAVGTILRRSA